MLRLPLSRSFGVLRARPLMAHSSMSICSRSQEKSRLRGVVFDMDGTLTVPVIDFAAMYKSVLGEEEYKAMRAKSPSGIDILQHIETWSPEKQQKAYEIIADIERQGLDQLQIMPGAIELCGFLNSNKIRRGLITRNVKDAVDLFHLRFGMVFTPAISREFRPYKPDPAPLLHICSTWDVQPNEVIMIGDSLKDDVYIPIEEKENALVSILGFSVVFMSVLCVDTCSSANFVFHHGEQHLVSNLTVYPRLLVGDEQEPLLVCLMRRGGIALLILSLLI
ncbi:hypothetical protein AAC387_Pa01g2918 [Persea americana]